MTRLAAILSVAACLLPSVTAQAAPIIVGDRATLIRLQSNSGMSLQWIDFDGTRRGRVVVTTSRDGLVHLSGSQRDRSSPAGVTLDGDVVSTGRDGFVLAGRVVIADAPDRGRRCVHSGRLEFRATGQRHYWRMRQMDGCDELTDYVDIYF